MTSKHLCRAALLLVLLLSSVGLSACDPSPPGQTAPQTNGTNTNGTNGTTSAPQRGPMLGLTPMRLLTRYEYDNTVRDLFGVEGAYARQAFTTENLTNGFENNAWAHNVSTTLLRNHLSAAEAIATIVVRDHRDRLLPCTPEAGAERACVEQGLQALLPRAFRRPVLDEEITPFLDQLDASLAVRDLDRSLELVVRAVLSSPQFLYRVELLSTPSGEMGAGEEMPAAMSDARFERLGDYELASRLSYFLWGTMPDAALFEAAARGELRTREQIAAQIDRMLADDHARAQVRQFHRQWLGLDKLDSVVKDLSFFPAYTPDVNQDWRASINAFIDHAYWEEGTFKAFMTSPALFMTPTLAPLYGVTVPEGVEGGIFRVDAPAQRAGILTQPALLAILAYPNQGSPISRGVFVREHIMCEPLPPPPNNIQITPPDPDPNATTREIFNIHTDDPQCAGCHLRIDPLGLGFERFDGIGAFRTVENGAMVDASGHIYASPSDEINVPFDGAQQLAEIFADSAHIKACMVSSWFQFAMGRPSDDSDAASLSEIQATFEASGGRFDALLKAIALSPAFRYRLQPDVAEAERAEREAERAEMTTAGAGQ